MFHENNDIDAYLINILYIWILFNWYYYSSSSREKTRFTHSNTTVCKRKVHTKIEHNWPEINLYELYMRVNKKKNPTMKKSLKNPKFYIYIYYTNRPFTWWLEWLPMAKDSKNGTWCIFAYFSIIGYRSRVKWDNI